MLLAAWTVWKGNYAGKKDGVIQAYAFWHATQS
jgi:hypothetical protein